MKKPRERQTVTKTSAVSRGIFCQKPVLGCSVYSDTVYAIKQAFRFFRHSFSFIFRRFSLLRLLLQNTALHLSQVRLFRWFPL